MGLAILIWTACAVAAYCIANDRAPSKARIAALFGLLLGPIGVAIAMFMTEEE